MRRMEVGMKERRRRVELSDWKVRGAGLLLVVVSAV